METPSIKPKLSYREFLVDFFGALMPGILFFIFTTMGILIQIIISLILLEKIYSKDKSLILDYGIELFKKLIEAPNILLFVTFLIILLIAYVIGTLFYRRDIKVPDLASFIKSASHFKDDELDNWVVKIKKKGEYISNPKEINTNNVKDRHVQYPYNNLKGYLISRRRIDLAKKIPWSPEESNKRSKTFINLLKIRIQFYFPQAYNTIIKNEAHIRLTSTLWYVAKTLNKTALWGMALIILVSGLFLYFEGLKSIIALSIIGLILSIISYLFSKSAISNSERFLHYQRVREIFYVLETARVASIEKKLDLFNIEKEF